MKVNLKTTGFDEPDISQVDIILNRYDAQKRKLISVLQDVQREYGYLPRNVLKLVAEKIGIQEIDVFSVATFYRGFSLEPKGEHVITLCMGTACHVRGGPSILEDIERLLDISAGQTTNDQKFTLETVNCLGACAIGPVVVIDGHYNGQMNIMKTRKLLCEYGINISVEEPESDRKIAQPLLA